MKTKLMYVPLIISIICMSSIYTAEKYANAQIEGKVKIEGNFLYFVKATGPVKFVEYIQKKLTSEHRKEKALEDFSLPSSDGRLVAQVGANRKCTITGNKEQGHATVMNQLSRTIFDTERKNNVSLDEKGGYRKKIELRTGDSIILKSLSSTFGSPSIKITCYEKMDSELRPCMSRLLRFLNKKSRNSDGTRIVTNNIIGMYQNPTGTRVAVHYPNLKGQVVDLENEKILFEGDNISGMYQSSTQKNILLAYTDYKTEMRHLEDGKTFYKDYNVCEIGLYENATIIAFVYENRSLAIKKLENGETFFKTKNLKCATLNKTKILLKHNSDKLELIPISYYE